MIVQIKDKSLFRFDIYDFSLTIYLCVLLAHQQENTIELLMRYASLAFVIGVYSYRFIRMPEVRGFYRYYILWLSALLGYGLLSMVWSIDPSNVFSTLYNILKVSLVCIVLLPNLRTMKDIEHVLSIVLLALCYMVLLLIIRTPFSTWGTDRIGSAINQHSNSIGRFANIGLLLSLYFCMETKAQSTKLFYFVLMLIFTVCALLTGSKNAIFIMIFQIGLYFYVISNNRKRFGIVFFSLLGVVALFWMVMNIQGLYDLVGIRLERMFALFMPKSNVTVDGSTMERMYFMRSGWRLFKQHPVIGVGMNNFSAYLRTIGYRNAKYSHSGFVEILSTLGIVGFVLYYRIFFKTFVLCLKATLRRNRLLTLLFVHTACLFVFDISTINMYNYFEYVLLLLAFCAANISLRQERRDELI